MTMMGQSSTTKPAVVAGRVEPREMLDLTLPFDHDVVDGAPTARFTKRLVERIEQGYGLMETAPDDVEARRDKANDHLGAAGDV